MRMILTGRPGKAESRKGLILTTITYTPPSDLELPPGVPNPPQKPMTFAVYVSAKQWFKVAEYIKKHEEEQLVLDGTCDYDPELQQMAMYAMHASTVTLEQRKAEKLERERQAQKAQVENNRARQKAGSESGKKPRQPAKPRETSPAPVKQSAPPPAPKVPAPNAKQAPEGAAPADAKKLSSLYAAAELYRQKISAIEAKPSNQRFGLEMMQKLLKTTEDEIANIEKKYTSA